MLKYLQSLNPFRTASTRDVLQAELNDAKRQLFEAQCMHEAYHFRIQHQQARIARLQGEIDGTASVHRRVKTPAATPIRSETKKVA